MPMSELLDLAHRATGRRAGLDVETHRSVEVLLLQPVCGLAVHPSKLCFLFNNVTDCVGSRHDGHSLVTLVPIGDADGCRVAQILQKDARSSAGDADVSRELLPLRL